MNTRKIVKIIVLYTLFFSIVFTSCGKVSDKGFETGRTYKPGEATPIDLKDVERIEESKSNLQYERVSNGYDSAEDLYWDYIEYIADDKRIFYIKEYTKLGQQYGEKFEVGTIPGNSTEQEILYFSPQGVYWMNELACNEKFLFWVEYWEHDKSKESSVPIYQIIQYDKETGEKKVVASRDANIYDEICLEAGDTYLTWYDSSWNEDGTQEGVHKVVVYDTTKGEFIDVEEKTVQKYMPYERLCQYDDGITYYTIDDNEMIYVNRYELNSRQKDSVAVGKKQDYPRLAGCFSTKEYFGWFTDYSDGVYYFVNSDTGEFNRISTEKDISISSKYCAGPYFFFNDRDANRIIRLEPFGKEYNYISLDTDQIGMQFHKAQTGQLYLKVISNGKTGMQIVDTNL